MSTHNIELVIPAGASCGWHREIAERLRNEGYCVAIRSRKGMACPPLLRAVLFFETRVLGFSKSDLLKRCHIEAAEARGPVGLRIDFVGAGTPRDGVPTLTASVDGELGMDNLPALVAAGTLPDITFDLDGVPFASAQPMIDNRNSLVRGLEDVLARVVSLTIASVGRVFDGAGPMDDAASGRLERPPRVNGSFARHYFGSLVPRLIHEVWRRSFFRHAHWRVGYRLIDDAGVAQSGDLSGKPWTVLPDSGDRFYADPFPFERDGRRYIFVEDYSHAEGKAVISVSEVLPDGRATPPRVAIAENHHLSYPQVFERDGNVFMLPEASAGRELVLYRATDFPHAWERHVVLFEHSELSDATILEHAGRLWLFATDSHGAGSTSDMMVVFYADRLEGPWTPHAANPVLIDHRRARPGGGFVNVNGNLLLPVQDGTFGYGGALGLSQLEALDTTQVKLAAPRPISAEGYWPYPAIHTLNRSGRLEVIDGIAAVPRWSWLIKGGKR